MPAMEELHLMDNNIRAIMPASSAIVKGFESLHLLNLEDNSLDQWDEIFKLLLLRSLGQLYLTKNNLRLIFHPDHYHRPFQNLCCLLLGGKGGIPRHAIIAHLAEVKILNGSEVSPRECKDSEIRYARSILSRFYDSLEEIRRLYPKFAKPKSSHGIKDQRPSIGATGPQKMAFGLISITLKCVGEKGSPLPTLLDDEMASLMDIRIDKDSTILIDYKS
ncbi:hypothetical protein RJ641_007735 [Dillenia turbinata]|uniref:Uncharacterized protein n=1 Tax=Dillenia turbinata TaxID=194707 RepID=A0AAN8V9J4_9MAGN